MLIVVDDDEQCAWLQARMSGLGQPEAMQQALTGLGYVAVKYPIYRAAKGHEPVLQNEGTGFTNSGMLVL